MTRTRPHTLHIMPGLRCNLSCAHCLNSSGPNERLQLTALEIEKIKKAIRRLQPRRLQFTGGEPTFYIDLINDLSSSHPDVEATEIMLTSNGWYSKSDQEIESVLSRLNKITHLQISFDAFHRGGISRECLMRLINYCKLQNIKINVSVCLREPLDLLNIQSALEGLDLSIAFQKVDAVGRAKKNKKAFLFPAFEASVFDKVCPNLGTLTYIAGRGFSTCCSNLLFNHPKFPSAHQTETEHFNSPFFLRISTKTIGEIAGIPKSGHPDLLPEFSSPCRLCEYSHTGT